MKKINIAIEISPLLSASGMLGDKSGVYRYMMGIIQEISKQQDRFGTVILFSFNRKALAHQLNPDIVTLTDHAPFRLVKNYHSIETKARMGSFMQRHILRYGPVKFVFRVMNKIFHIKNLYADSRESIHFKNYIHFLEKEFHKYGVTILYHSETGFYPMPKFKQITTIYDLTTLIIPEFHKKETIDLHDRKLSFMRDNCDGIICISESTKKDLLKFYPMVKKRPIITIYPGIDPGIIEFADHTTAGDVFKDIVELCAQKQHILIHKQYLLYYGTFEPRKNLFYLMRTFVDLQKQKKIPSSLKLVMVGGGGWGNTKKTITNYIAENFPLAKRNNILVFDFLSDQYIFSFISHALAVIYPSVYEGFGLPVLESMALGTPVICAHNSSLPEVGGDAAIYFDANRYNALGESIEKICSANKKSLENYIAKGYKQSSKFLWEDTSKGLYNFIKKL